MCIRRLGPLRRGAAQLQSLGSGGAGRLVEHDARSLHRPAAQHQPCPQDPGRLDRDQQRRLMLSLKNLRHQILRSQAGKELAAVGEEVGRGQPEAPGLFVVSCSLHVRQRLMLPGSLSPSGLRGRQAPQNQVLGCGRLLRGRTAVGKQVPVGHPHRVDRVLQLAYNVQDVRSNLQYVLAKLVDTFLNLFHLVAGYPLRKNCRFTNTIQTPSPETVDDSNPRGNRN
mmetsp:Transcript_4031/g.9725  ORF Transcript_4031/g.9725 Transcript_4031/m.9725 type:complete len:225 (+) Transcript_4031:410-1084(+)